MSGMSIEVTHVTVEHEIVVQPTPGVEVTTQQPAQVEISSVGVAGSSGIHVGHR